MSKLLAAALVLSLTGSVAVAQEPEADIDAEATPAVLPVTAGLRILGQVDGTTPGGGRVRAAVNLENATFDASRRFVRLSVHIIRAAGQDNRGQRFAIVDKEYSALASVASNAGCTALSIDIAPFNTEDAVVDFAELDFAPNQIQNGGQLPRILCNLAEAIDAERPTQNIIANLARVLRNRLATLAL